MLLYISCVLGLFSLGNNFDYSKDMQPAGKNA